MLDHHGLQQAIIGSLLLWPQEIDAVASVLNVDDFYHEKYRVVYNHLLKKEGGDLITVTHALQSNVSASELVGWMDAQVTSALLPRYCSELKETANKLRLLDVANELRTDFAESSLSDMIDKVESTISRMASAQSSEPSPAPELMKDALVRLKRRYETRGTIQGLPYGFADLDIATCGMHPGDLIIVAGRPSMGKSAFAGNTLEHVCALGKTGMAFTLEMDKGNMVDRMISARGGIDYGRMRSGDLADVEWPKLDRVQGQISAFKMLIDDTPAVSLREIRHKAKKQKRHGLDFLMVDYLQLMSVPKADSRSLAIGEVSRGLKRLARELDIPIMLLSQLNRSVDSRPDKRPTMSDLRDSGEIEQDADVILFPFRPAAYCQKCKDKVVDSDHDPVDHQAEAEIIIEKQRNGERNITVPLVWQGHFQRFSSLSRGDLPDF